MPELDGVRGLAIAMVMALHFVNNAVIPTTVVERAAIKLTNYGLWGVDLFFVLSGFLITGILLDAKGRPGYFRNFYARRTLRIFPLYYGVLLLLTVLIPAAVLQAFDPQLLDLRRLWPWLYLYGTNIYLGPETSFSIPYVSHFWSLAVEEHFYLAWPLLVYWMAPAALMRACIGLGAAALALRVGFSYNAPEQLYAGVLTPCRIDALLAGAWFAVAARQPQPLPIASARTVAWTSGLLLLALSAWQFALHTGQAVVLPLRTLVLAVFFAATIYLAAYSDLAWLKAGLRQAWLRHLGRYSYGLYVFHGIVAYAMHRYGLPEWFSHLTPMPLLGSLLMIAFGVGVSYAIAIASFHLFESPFLSLKRFFEAPRVAGPEIVVEPPVRAAFTRPRSASILINNFNYGHFVGDAILSALNQTSPAQVIVVDDGSTDESRRVIERFGPRIRAIFQANSGQGSAMNAGFAEATGDLVLFLDADDMLDVRAVETLLAAWQPSTVLAQYPLHIVDENGARLGIYPDPPTTLSHGDVRVELLRTGSFGACVTSGLAFHRQALTEVMPLPAHELRNAADGYLVRAIAFLGEVQRLDTPLGSYRRHDSNDSNVWATPGGLADGFRKKIGYAEREIAVTRQLAARHGLTAAADLGKHNAEYVGYLLFLLLTEPRAAEVAGQNRLVLLGRYIAARWQCDWPVKRRLLFIGLTAAATVTPRALSLECLRWMHDPGSRPMWLRALRGRRRQLAA